MAITHCEQCGAKLMIYDYSENILVQEAAGTLLHDHLLKKTHVEATRYNY